MLSTGNSRKIAIVEDDAILREELSQFLKIENFVVYEANNWLSLNDIFLVENIDLVILDLNLPGKSGLDIAKSVRETFPRIGIVMLTARTGLTDRINGYEHGADIYLPKPTPPQELLAAINSITRRLAENNFNHWTLHIESSQLAPPNGKPRIDLNSVESLLLKTLSQSVNKSLESEILTEILSEHLTIELMTKRSLENIISRLRKKIQPNLTGEERRIIHSVWGAGYQLCLPLVVLND